MNLDLTTVEGGVTIPIGFKATGVSCGLKEKEVAAKDIGLILSEKPCIVSAAFTKNEIKAAPIIVSMKRINNPIYGVIVNSGNANCLTGETGINNAIEMTNLVEQKLNLPEGSILVASTGVIGRKLLMDRVKYGIEKVCNMIAHENDYKNFSHAIMTTDSRMKNVGYEFTIDEKKVRIGATAKGAGMIKPDMSVYHATMLVFISTDVNITKNLLDQALNEALEISFNRISVDNDTSTNDTVFILANGMSENKLIDKPNENYLIFKEVLIKVCQDIAKLIVKDGEGATKLIHIVVKNALTTQDAIKIARSVADSYLVKTAIFGQSPNWGRILAAVGYSGAKFNLNKIKLFINDLVIFENGEENRLNVGKATGEMIPNEIQITIDLGLGRKEYFLWTSDLTYDYIKINAHYIS